jgi:hypothetical protein
MKSYTNGGWFFANPPGIDEAGVFSIFYNSFLVPKSKVRKST